MLKLYEGEKLVFEQFNREEIILAAAREKNK